MKTSSVNLLISTALLMFAIAISAPEMSGQSNKLITAGSAGPVKIGMTLSEVRKALPGSTFEAVTDGDGVPLIAVNQGKNVLFHLYAGQDEAREPLDPGRKIEQIEIWDPSYKLKTGVGPETLLADASKKYGGISVIMESEIEARQYVEFVNGPPDIGFRIDYSGVFKSGENRTKDYKKGAKIFSLIISGESSETTGGFYSEYTDLEKECNTPEGQGEEGGHVSTYCKGPDKYRVHMFDTAGTMEITVDAPGSDEYILIVSEKVSFTTKGKKLEWRIKNGVPFAVIMRANKYSLDENELIKYPVKVTGEYLFVRGLHGFESIRADVNVGTTRYANEEARKIADEGYLKVSQADVKLDISEANQMISDAENNGESWVKSAMQIATRIAGEFTEARTRKMYFEAMSPEDSDSITLTIVDDGLLDDSSKGEKRVYKLERDENGVWRVSSAKKAWACWPGRGHEDFSAVPCV